MDAEDKKPISPGPISPLHAFLAGLGPDGSGRRLDEVLALPDSALERIHDYIQWLFPLATRSGAQPNAPVLSRADLAAIPADPAALANLRRATARMLAFYRANDHWLVRSDHNHLRITRIIASLRQLAGIDDARAFHAAIMARQNAVGSPVDPGNLAYWDRALAGA
jgi:hypothetical protein